MFEKILLPEYQSYDIENCLILSPIYHIRFNNLDSASDLPGLSQKRPGKSARGLTESLNRDYVVVKYSKTLTWSAETAYIIIRCNCKRN